MSRAVGATVALLRVAFLMRLRALKGASTVRWRELLAFVLAFARNYGPV